MGSRKILIIERSSIIVKGISEILNTSDLDISIEECAIEDNIAETVKRIQPQIILLNPALLISTSSDKFNNIVKSCKRSNTSLLGLIYAYIEPEIVEQFESTIHINDTPLSIIEKVNNIIKRESQDKKHNINVTPSQRELEIIRLVALGYSNKEIADQLFISVHTVISHRKNITVKLGVKSTSAITIYAVINNIISEDDFKDSI